MASHTPSALDRAERLLQRLAQGLAVIGGVALAGLMAITVVAVVWRYALNDPIFGIEDLSTMTLSVVVAAAVAYGAHHRAHVSVDLIGALFGRRVTRVTDTLARALGLVIVAVATYALFVKGSCGLRCGNVTNNLGIVHTPFYYVLGVAMGSYALLLAVRLAAGIAHWRDEDPGEARD